MRRSFINLLKRRRHTNKNIKFKTEDSEDDSSSSEESFTNYIKNRKEKDIYEKPQYSSEFPVDTDFYMLPDIGTNFEKTGDLSVINNELIRLKMNLMTLEENINKAYFSVNEAEEERAIQEDIKNISYHAAQIQQQLIYYSTIIVPNENISKQNTDTHNYLTKELFFHLAKLSMAKKEYKKRQNLQLKKMVRVINPELSEIEVEDRIERYITSDDYRGTANLIETELLYDKENAKIALQYAKEQRDELLKIEKNIALLQQMSIDLASLITYQGDMLNRIEHNLSNSIDSTSKGLKMLGISETKKISARKKKVIIGLTVVAVAGVVTLAIAGLVAGIIILVS